MPVDVALIHPPVALPCEPSVGLGVLAAGLRARGLRVTVLDANLEAMLQLVGSVPAEAAQQRHTRERRALLGRERSLALLRSPAGYRNLDRYRGAVGGLGELLRMASPPGARIGLANYLEERRSPLRSEDLRAAAAEPDASPFRAAFASLAERVADLAPKVVGVSVAYLHQVLPALALCAALRRRLPGVRLLVGGALLACWQDRLPRGALRPVVDRLVFGDGLPALLEELGLGGAGGCEVELAPDYSDAPFASYLAPEPIAPVPLSRGCFWRRCRYCPDALAARTFRPVPEPAIGARLDETRRRSGADLLHLSDSALPPEALGALSQFRGQARWYGFARFVPELASAELCAGLRRSGCLMLQLGLESGSPRVLGRLRKGIDVGLAERVLETLADAGIAVYLYLMFGVPGERREDALQTLEFVARNAARLAYLNTSLLNLPVGSPAEEDLELLPLEEGPADLGLYSGFRSREGWDRRAARHFLEREFAREPCVAALLRRTPPIFGANHAPFFVRGGT
jgi:hypothetical protein